MACTCTAHVRLLEVIQMNLIDSNYHLPHFLKQELQVENNLITFYDII